MQTVIGLFENARDAQNAAQQLMQEGFTSDNVDVSVRGDGSNDSSGSSSSGNYSSDENTSGVFNTTSGSTTGSSDYTTGSNYQSGSLSDSNVTGSTRSTSGDYDRTNDGDSFGDKVSRFFKNLFGNDDDEAGRYSHVASKTGNMVTVHAQSDEEAERAADILDEYGAVDVNERAAEYGYSGNNNDNNTDRMSTGVLGTHDLASDRMGTGNLETDDVTSDRMRTGNLGTGDVTTDRMGTGNYATGNTNTDRVGSGDYEKGDTLKVIKEDVQVGKREVETGGVRLRSRIVERPVEETLRLREEKVTVERNPVDRPATSADFENFKEGEIEMTESAEVADVTKQARVVEEVKLSKEVNERTETINETARDTEVDVENLSKGDTNRKYNKKKDM